MIKCMSNQVHNRLNTYTSISVVLEFRQRHFYGLTKNNKSMQMTNLTKANDKI